MPAEYGEQSAFRYLQVSLLTFSQYGAINWSKIVA